MKGTRFSEEQIIGVLREHEAGAKMEEVCRRHGISRRAMGSLRDWCCRPVQAEAVRRGRAFP